MPHKNVRGYSRDYTSSKVNTSEFDQAKNINKFKRWQSTCNFKNPPKPILVNLTDDFSSKCESNEASSSKKSKIYESNAKSSYYKEQEEAHIRSLYSKGQNIEI